MFYIAILIQVILFSQLPGGQVDKWRKGWMGTKGRRISRRAPSLGLVWTGATSKEQKINKIKATKHKTFINNLIKNSSPTKILTTIKGLGWGNLRKGVYSISKNFGGPKCYRLLRQLGIPYKLGPFKKFMKYPVSLPQKSIGGIYYNWAWGTKPALIMDCRMVISLYLVAPIFLKYGFDEVIYTSTYRHTKVAGTRHWSRHAYGMAIDIKALRGPNGHVGIVERDWVRLKGTKKNCVGSLPRGIARTLRSMICEIEKYPIFRRILTPDYNHGHRDHFHVSGAKPGEMWRRLWYGGKPITRKLSTYYHKPCVTGALLKRPKFLSKKVKIK